MTLPDFLATETEQVIIQRMLDRVSDDIDKTEGSYIYDALAAVAPEIYQMKIDMGQYLNRAFASTTFGAYLDYRCEEHGVARKSAISATGAVKFTGLAHTSIFAGTQVATPADQITGTASVLFATTATVELDDNGIGYADVEALEAGIGGNVAAGKINLLVVPINCISSVTNEAPTTGGTDIESDANLLVRFLSKVRNPGTSGNKADYRNWALEIDGVGDAQIVPLWNGNGTVKVVLLDTDKQPASQSIVDDVLEYIAPEPAQGERKAPIGASVTVMSATPVPIYVAATVVGTGTKTLAEIQSAFESALTGYLKDIAFDTDPTVRYGRIGSILLDTEGVKDYSNLQVNDGTANIVINADEVAVIGTVTLS